MGLVYSCHSFIVTDYDMLATRHTYLLIAFDSAGSVGAVIDTGTMGPERMQCVPVAIDRALIRIEMKIMVRYKKF